MKSVQKIVIGCMLCLAVIPSFSQNLQTTIKVQAMNMAKALINNDYTAFIGYMPPKIIAFAGGEQKLKKDMDSASTTMKQFGVEFKNILIGNPGPIINYEHQLQCIVPQTTTMQTMLGELQAETSLIAISADNGKKWYFIDTNVYKANQLKNILPGLSPDLQIPVQKQPKFTPKQ